jgi:hypothetical protein
MWSFFTLIVLSLSISAHAAAELPYTFNLSGKFYESPIGNDPLEDANIEVRLQILNAAKSCILYDERQFVSTTSTEGSYSIKVGSAAGTAKRVSGSDPGNTMEQIFQNAAAVLANCSGSMTTNLPVMGAARHLRIMVKPTGAASFETLAPEILIGAVPSAFVADTLGGLTKDQFLKPGATGNLNQTNLENLFSSTNYPTLTGLLSGSSPSSGGSSAGNYVLTADNGNANVGEIRFATGSTVKALITNAGDLIANQKIGIGTGTVVPSTDLAFGGDTDRMVGVERNTVANSEGKKLIIEAGGATSSSTDKNGGDLYLSSGMATGTGSSKILFETTAAGVTGSADRTPTTKMVLDGTGKLGLGVQAPVGNLELLVTGSGHKGFVNRLLADDAFAAQQVFFKSRGTGPLQTGDAIGNIRFAGFDGTNEWSPTVGLAQTTAAQIRAHSAEPWTPTSHGGYLAIATTPKGSTSPADRLVIDSAGNVGLGVGLAPSATLHLRAGRADEFGGPLKFTSGPLLTIPEDGVMEFLTNKLYFSVGTTRYQIPFAENTGNLSSVSSISNATGNISITPQVGGSVTVIGAHSSSSSTGALIVDGGIGVSNNIVAAGSVSSAINYAPQLYGASTAAADIRIDGTDHATKGNVLLGSAGGFVGIGTSSPSAKLHVSGGDARIGNLTVGHGLSGNNTNTGLGSGVLASTTSGYSNTAVGINTLTLTTTGTWNTAIGQFALSQNVSGNGNTAIGGALGANVGGSFNVGLGDRNLSANVSGNYNTSGGRQSLFASTGSSNTAYGINSALNLTAGDNNLAIGANTNLPNPTGSNQMNIANLLFATGITGSSIAPAGSLGIGVSAPTATLHLKAGTVVANTAPLKFTSGPLLTAPEDGVMEYLTDKLYFSVGSNRYVIPFSSTTGQYTNVSSISNSGNIAINPNSGAGSVTITGAVSTSSSSGALIIAGGAGISQDLNVGGSISSGTHYTPQIFGSSASNGSVKIDGTSHATKGPVLLSSGGGSVGIGTLQTNALLTLGPAFFSSANSGTFSSNSGTLPSTAGSELRLASFGFNSANETHLGIYGVRTAAGSAWTTTAIGLGIDVDSSPRVNNGALWFNSNGHIGIGEGAKTAARLLTLDDPSLPVLGFYTSGTERGTIRANTAGVMAFDTLGTTRLAIDATGNVGLGTTAPWGRMHIAGPNSNTPDTGLVLTREMTSGNEAGSAIFHYLSSGTTHDMLAIGVTGDGSTVGKPNDISRAKMVVTAAGRVGIGTILPQVPLDVGGTIKSHISDGNHTGVQLGNNGGEEGMISFHQSDNSRRFFMQVNSVNSSSERLSFYAGPLNNAATDETLTLAGTGRVGIGISNPLEKLDVGGNIFARGGKLFLDRVSPSDEYSYISPLTPYHSGLVFQTTYSGTAYNRMTIDREGRMYLGSKLFVQNSGDVGIGTTAPGYPLDIVGTVRATDYLFSSDRRLKKNINSIPHAVEAVKKLRGVEFDWKQDGRASIGFIAQEVEKVFPQLVKTDSTGMKSVQYGNITAIILEAMKEYFTKNDADKEALKLRLAKSEKANEEMKRNFEQKLQKLSARLEALEGKASDH